MKSTEKMPHNEFIRYMSQNSEYTMTDCKEMVNVVFSCLTSAVQEYDEVEIYSFGKFSKKHKAERKGLNIQGNTILVPPFDTIGFKASKKIKEKLNGE